MKPFNPNRGPQSNIYKPEEQPFSVEQKKFLENKYQKMLQDALDPNDFQDVYDKEFIDNCILETQRLEGEFKKDNKITEMKGVINDKYSASAEYREASRYMEALFYNKLGGKNGWIPDAMIWKTSQYDDIFKGIDFMVEAGNGELSLGTDITFSSSKGLNDKLGRIKKQIDSGDLPEAVFFESSVHKVKAPTPRIVIAVERNKLIQGLKLWADGQGDLLNNHPMKVKTELMIEAQLEAFAIYARSANKRDIAAEYNNLLAYMQRSIAGNREEVIKKYETQLNDDQAYQTVIAFCDTIKNK